MKYIGLLKGLVGILANIGITILTSIIMAIVIATLLIV